MPYKQRREKIGSLDCIIIAPQKIESKRAVVLFHGYGADNQDLAPLYQYIDAPEDVTWIFPNGVMEVLIGPAWTGRAWFNIDTEALEEAMRSGTHRQLDDVRPAGMDHAMDQALNFWDIVTDLFDDVIVGGFSQGSMLSTELAFRAPKKPKALVILSGTMLDQDNWKKLAADCDKLPFFQSHGSNDALLSLHAAHRLRDLLKTSGFKGEYYDFKGGHEIPPAILEKLSLFVSKQF